MTNILLHDKTISDYLACNVFQVDEIFCRFSSWSKEIYGFEVKRYYRHMYQIDFDKYEYKDIDKEEYFNNIEDRSYITGLNYNEFIKTKDFEDFFSEFNYNMHQKVIYSLENDFIEYIKKSIDNADTNGKSKSILKNILLYIQDCIIELEALNKNSLNEVQSFLIDIFSGSYKSSLERLLTYYKNIYSGIVSEFEIIPEPPAIEQTSSINDNQNQYNEIFKNNAFEVWEILFHDFNIKSSSRADTKFCYEIMKHDGLIHKTVKQVDFLDWINTVYQISIGKPQFSDWRTDSKRTAIYNNAKKNYKKQ